MFPSEIKGVHKEMHESKGLPKETNGLRRNSKDFIKDNQRVPYQNQKISLRAQSIA